MARWFPLSLAVALTGLTGLVARAADADRRLVSVEQGQLTYHADARGNRCPDFSTAGYDNGVSLPAVPVKVTVAPGRGDTTARIQAALDHVSSLPADKSGFRGAATTTAAVCPLVCGWACAFAFVFV